MGIVSAKEVARVMNLDKFGFLGTSMGWVVLKTTQPINRAAMTARTIMNVRWFINFAPLKVFIDVYSHIIINGSGLASM